MSRCLTGDGSPLTGGHAISHDGAGPSGGNPWPSGLSVFMGRVGLVEPVARNQTLMDEVGVTPIAKEPLAANNSAVTS